MTEEFLHHIWRTRQFNPANLRVTDGRALEIIYPGEHNIFSGPDFFNAKLRIGDQLWAGNVEIHVKASDWMKHRHQEDEAYGNVVLHVVYEADREISARGNVLPALELKERVPGKLWTRYSEMRGSKDRLACAGSMAGASSFTVAAMLGRAIVERLERKTDEIRTELLHSGNDWEETFYRRLAHRFGMNVNAEPFHRLALSLPFRLLMRHADQPHQGEALLFGQAGLLDDAATDAYMSDLQREYRHLRKKYSLQSIETHAWKFMRLRPGNFPTLRISQLAALLTQRTQLFRACMEMKTAEELEAFFDVQASAYWDTHYRFRISSKECVKRLGAQATDVILINTVAPVKFLYGKMKKEERYCDEAIALLEEINAEENSVTRLFSAQAMELRNSADTQGALELKKNYCDRKRCLDCEIGRELLGR
ncbi:MAG TPA: DUF2851 family protein [Bacteroidia bacterium]|nr:DUF2851 family protein [Bacteroidia bacterium]